MDEKTSNTITLNWDEYISAARRIVAEGCVLAHNNGVLPFERGTRLSVFGRMQLHYYKSGTGSGGMVNISKQIGIMDALLACDWVSVNKELLNTYLSWDEEHPLEEGEGWGAEPWSQEEMPLAEGVIEEAAKVSDAAVVIIARTAGEDKDVKAEAGSYLLTDIEEDMLSKVRAHFGKVVVLLNVPGIIDMSFVDTYKPDAVMYVWQGGMIGGLGTVDVLVGKETPSGHFTDTVCYAITDQLSNQFFGNQKKNFYGEDIYVGYRYFETFNQAAVRYPFGYGLSYTDFSYDNCNVKENLNDNCLNYSVSVKNTGRRDGKAVIQLYMEAPQGNLGKPKRVLIGFAKTKSLAAGEDCEIFGEVSFREFASYDDSGITGHRSCFVLEPGCYKVYLGENVRDATLVHTYTLQNLIVLEELYEALAPVEAFERVKPILNEDGTCSPVFEEVPLARVNDAERRNAHIPEEIVQTGDKGIQLADVLYGKNTMEEFVAQLSDNDLSCIVRGEGMGSSRVTPGTAAAFGGVSDHLSNRFGIPAVCCSDGPSGMRLDCGAKAFSLPNGTMLGCTFNVDLVSELYSFLGREMIYNKVDCLLGPGMNIHRHLLNGRNFEYFSEDPHLTGMMALAVIRGLKQYGVTGVAKHFCGNNQEYGRHVSDSVISERALREIYLRGFEIVVKSGYADSIMTTYGSVNGLWTAGSYDLNTTILREQWGFQGIVMTDWWAAINERGCKPDHTNFAAMVRAQNDLYMVCPDGSTNASGDNTLEALADGKVMRSELQRCAVNIAAFAMKTEAMKRKLGCGTKIEIEGRPEDDMDVMLDDVSFMVLDGDITVPLDEKDSKAGTSYIIPFDIKTVGDYEVTLVGSSTLGELAQIPCTLFYSGYPILTYTFNGSGGKDYEISRETIFRQRFAVMRLYVARNGVKLKEIRFRFLNTI